MIYRFKDKVDICGLLFPQIIAAKFRYDFLNLLLPPPHEENMHLRYSFIIICKGPPRFLNRENCELNRKKTQKLGKTACNTMESVKIANHCFVFV